MSSQGSISPPAARHNESQRTVEHAEQTGSATQGRKKRIRTWTADDRAAHRVFERSRREAFKGRLTALANLIPALQSKDPNRLSKHVVLDKSIALHKAEQHKLRAALQQIDHLLEEREELLTEVNQWRTGAGLGVRKGRNLEPLPDINPPTSDNGLDNQLDTGGDDLPTSMHSIPLQPEHETAQLASFKPLPIQMPALDQPSVIGHNAIPPSSWEVMGMDMNTHEMDASMGFNDMFTTNVLGFPGDMKPLNDMDPTAYIPPQPLFPQQPINMINLGYGGDPPIYGQ